MYFTGITTLSTLFSLYVPSWHELCVNLIFPVTRSVSNLVLLYVPSWYQHWLSHFRFCTFLINCQSHLPMHIFSSDTNNVRVSFSLHLPSWHEYSKYNTCTSLACTICHIHFRYMYLPNTNTACVSIIFALCTILRRTLCQSIFRYMCHPLTNTVSSLIAICTTLGE